MSAPAVGKPDTDATVAFGTTNIASNSPPALNNADGKIDGFKFKNLIVSSSAVPEPATWAMMILGFGMVGSGMRRRNMKTNVSFA